MSDLTKTQEEQDALLDEKFGHIMIFKEWKSRDEKYGGIKTYLHSRDAAIEAATIERVIEWIEHSKHCICAQFEAGEPTEGGGYRQKFAGKWYESSPIDKTPKCDCGLDDILSALTGLNQKV